MFRHVAGVPRSPIGSRAVSAEPCSPATVLKRTNAGSELPAFWTSSARVYFARERVTVSVPWSPPPLRVDHPLRDSFPVEVGHSLEQLVIVHQHRAPWAGREVVLVVG